VGLSLDSSACSLTEGRAVGHVYSWVGNVPTAALCRRLPIHAHSPAAGRLAIATLLPAAAAHCCPTCPLLQRACVRAQDERIRALRKGVDQEERWGVAGVACMPESVLAVRCVPFSLLKSAHSLPVRLCSMFCLVLPAISSCFPAPCPLLAAFTHLRRLAEQGGR